MTLGDSLPSEEQGPRLVCELAVEESLDTCCGVEWALSEKAGEVLKVNEGGANPLVEQSMATTSGCSSLSNSLSAGE